jgi:hypothetical protein
MCVKLPPGRVRLDVDAEQSPDEDDLQAHVEVAALFVRERQVALVGYLAAERTPGGVVGGGDYEHLQSPVGWTGTWHHAVPKSRSACNELGGN